MPWYEFIWSDEPGDNIEHIAQHDLTPAAVEHVVMHPAETTRSRSSDRLAVTGDTPDGRHVFVVYD